jgi:hypothetical protein
MRSTLLLVCALMGFASPARSGFVLAWPVACQVGKTCEIQHYVDHGSGGRPADYRCGSVTYAGHNGTDIRLPSMDLERAGVDVLAAAPGQVLRLRDDMADVSVDVIGHDAIKGRDCGNGLVIAHADGFETQYCHMAKGSLVVKAGDHVTSGQPLGRVGLSGDTEFPHLHITVRHNGAVIDPFAYGEAAGACEGGASLWAPALADALGYKNGAVLNAGFLDHAPAMGDIENGLQRMALTPATPALVAYFRAITLRAGDVQRIEFNGPTGPLQQAAPALPSNKDQVFLAFGRKRPPGGWPAGTYTAHYSVARDGRTVAERTVTTTFDAGK